MARATKKSQTDAPKQITSINDLIPDDENANLGTVRGRAMLEHSLEQYGGGRSALADKNGKLIAGNKTVEAAAEKGMEIIVVPSDGTKLVVVQRTDLDLDKDARARELAFADNRVAQVDLNFDPEKIAAMHEKIDLSNFWSKGELSALLGVAPQIDYEQAWGGMPEFDQQDQSAYRTIKVHFANDADIAAFAQLIGQTVTSQTKFVWYPAKDHLDLKQYKAADDES